MFPIGTVTFLFTDVEGSTRLWEQNPEAMKSALARHDSILREVIESKRGHIIKTTGDGVHAVFVTALDGVEASIAIQHALLSDLIILNSPFTLKVRMGLHTGEAELRDGDYYGQALNRTARIMSVGHGGQVLISDVTAQVVREHLAGDIALQDMGSHHLKGLLKPERIHQVNAPKLEHNFPPLQSLPSKTNNLPPQFTSFVGRERELTETINRLVSSRLVTLIGPGGTGKTRLSLQVAEAQLNEFKDGAWFVELAAITDPAYIVASIAAVFNLREVQGTPLLNVLMDYLRGKQLLLILDNCEHLVEACAELANQLLHECAGLKILASSREALGINGEAVYRVPSLKEDEATRLFIERATKADSRFRATESNASFIAQICSRLDGIPLALELAAARVKLFSPQQIAERLDDRFKLLTGGSRTALPRQQTLRALIDWSYQTLNGTEQRTLRRLAVFSGGWTFEAAEAVVGESEAMDGLAGLVNKSLVNVEEKDGTSRYFFLETIRQYAMEKLVEAGEANEARDRQLEYMSQFVAQPQVTMFGLDHAWLERIDSEKDNLRAALEWALNHRIETAIQLALKVGTYWAMRDYISEALSWYHIILQTSEGLPGLDEQRASIYSLLGWTSILVGQHREGRAAAQTAIAIAKEVHAKKIQVFGSCTVALASVFLGDIQAADQLLEEVEVMAREQGLKEELALVVSTRAQAIYFSTHDGLKAKRYLDESIELVREVGYRWETAFQIFGQGRLAAALGDIETARMKFNEGIEIARRVGNNRMVYSNRSELAHVLREHGQLDEALTIYQEIIPGWKELGHRAALAHELECVGYIYSRKEEPEKAILLVGAAQTIRNAIDMPRTRMEEMEYEKELSTVKAMLGEDKFQAHWKKGTDLSVEQAIHLALS